MGNVIASAECNQLLELGLLDVGIRVRMSGHNPNAVLSNGCWQLLKVC